MSSVSQQLEAFLFWKGAPASVQEIAQALGVSPGDARDAATALGETLRDRGLALVAKDDEFLLTTAPAMSPLIEKLIKEDLERDLGKAGLETLTIVLYYGPVTRARIDYIRGVNSTFTLRALMVRGLVERTENPHDGRGFLYKPTFELLSFLGIKTLAELPKYAETREELERFEKEHTEETNAAPESTGTNNDGTTV